MTQEQKAKAYDEAIERARKLKENPKAIFFEEENIHVSDYIFPELHESEDEKIRKEIHIYLDWLDGRNKDYQPKGEYSIRDMIAWLEKKGEQKSLDDVAKEVAKDKDAAISFLKSTGIMNENGELADEYKIEQDEQKPFNYENATIVQQDFAPKSAMEAIKEEKVDNAIKVEQKDYSSIDSHFGKLIEQSPAWSEEDKKCINELIKFFDSLTKCLATEERHQENRRWLKFLKSLKEKVQTQPVWSEEDEINYNYALAACKYYGEAKGYADTETHQKTNNWLKSLKERYTWKPSDKQMNALDSTLQYSQVSHNSVEHLNSLFNDLKKLKLYDK